MAREYLFPTVQGSILETVERIKNIEPKTKATKLLEKKYENRFFRDTPVFPPVKEKDRWIRNVLRSYHEYYIDVLTERMTSEQAEKMLVQRLNERTGVSDSTVEEIETELEKGFLERGYHFNGGRTTPHYGPYIWKRTEVQTFQVELPSGTQELSVSFMHDFISLSWLHFATFGHFSTGGWATESEMFCVYDGYKKYWEKDIFLVSFLKHEAQHCSDKTRYPNLIGQDLEYRAKLVELIYYHDRQAFDRFRLGAANNPDVPHVFAEYSIIRGLSELLFDEEYVNDPKHWRRVDYEEIIKGAQQLLQEHTEKLDSLGADVKSGLL